jgi:hypothetical protein
LWNWLCCYNLIMLLNSQCIWLCYIFSIIRHIIIICGVSGWKLYFILFYIYKIGVGFTSPSEPMRHPFRNDAPHIKLWGASFLNCSAYFGQPENDFQRVLSGYASCDRTTSEMRGLSFRIQIGWFSMKRECMQTHIRIIQNHNFIEN